MASDRQIERHSAYLDSWTKRCLDMIVCSLLLPPALIVIAVAGLSILFREGRPVFFVHRRAGRNGELFWLPKLRTLRADADPYRLSTESEKESLTTVTGRAIRRHRIDELPQLFSVLTGRMSLVGPRPELPNVVAGYRCLDRKLLSARPGVTGLWQIRADRNEKIGRNMKYDLYYLRKASLWLDVWILVMTVPFVLNPK